MTSTKTRTVAKTETKGLSSDLLKPVGAALAAWLTTWIVTQHFGTEQTTLLVYAGATFLAGYFVGPTPADHWLARLRLSKKQIAAAIVAAGTVLATWIATGAFDRPEVSVLVTAAVGILLGVASPPDPTEPKKTAKRRRSRRPPG